MRINEDNYLKDRLEDQIAWFEAKSAACQKQFKRLRLIEIVCAALIPFLSGAATTLEPWGQWIIGGLGVTIAISAGFGSLNRYQENWITYRATAEQLKQERFYFLTASGPYAEGSGLSLLVQRVETLLAKENATWAQGSAMSSKTDKTDQNGKPPEKANTANDKSANQTV